MLHADGTEFNDRIVFCGQTCCFKVKAYVLFIIELMICNVSDDRQLVIDRIDFASEDDFEFPVGSFFQFGSGIVCFHK